MYTSRVYPANSLVYPALCSSVCACVSMAGGALVSVGVVGPVGALLGRPNCVAAHPAVGGEVRGGGGSDMWATPSASGPCGRETRGVGVKQMGTARWQ